jgi:hypothetical protein
VRANEFCYWLQGYFEIGEADGGVRDVLTAAGVRCVKAHLALVKKVEPEHANVFVAWLSERLERADGNKAIDSADIRRFLAAQFQHAIDPSYGGDQKELGKVHGTSGSGWPTDGLIRC